MKKPFYLWTIFKRFLSFDLENRNSSNSLYRSTNYQQIKVWAADGRIICRSRFNLPIQDLCADQSSICIWKNNLQIKVPSADQRMICNWFATGFRLQLTDLQLQFATDGRTSRTLLLLLHTDWHDREVDYYLTMEDLFQFQCFRLLDCCLAKGSYDFGFVHPSVRSFVMHFSLHPLIFF